MQFDDFSILVIAQEDEDGSRVLEEAVKVFRDGRPAEPLGRPELELRYTSGTRDVETAAVRFAGRAEKVMVAQLIPLHMAVGSGYGLDADWRHGMYQGPEPVVQQVVMPAAEAAAKSGMFGITERLSRFDYDGPEGRGPGTGCSRRCSSARTGRAGSRTGWPSRRSRARCVLVTTPAGARPCDAK